MATKIKKKGPTREKVEDQLKGFGYANSHTALVRQIDEDPYRAQLH